MENFKEKSFDLIEKRKEEILAAAMKVFADNGYRRTKIEDIADYLNVGKGTIYRYYKSKKQLFLEVFYNGTRELMDLMHERLDGIKNPVEKQKEAVRTYFSFFDEQPELIEIMMQVRSDFKDEYRQQFLDCYNDYIERIQENLESGIRQGLFRELDIVKTADSIAACLQGVLQSFYIRKYGREDLKLSEVAESVSQMILHGLEKQK